MVVSLPLGKYEDKNLAPPSKDPLVLPVLINVNPVIYGCFTRYMKITNEVYIP